MLPCKEETLLVWWDSLFVLDFVFYILNCVTCPNPKSDGFTRLSVSLHNSVALVKVAIMLLVQFQVGN